MANPAKVLAFLDLAGRWDPSLAFVMAGGILGAAPAFVWARSHKLSLLGAPLAGLLQLRKVRLVQHEI